MEKEEIHQRSNSPFDKEKNYSKDNLEYKKILSKTKHKKSSTRFENHKRSPKINDGDGKNYEFKGKKQNDYSESNSFSRKSNRNYPRDLPKGKNKSRYHDSDYEIQDKRRGDIDTKYPNIEKLNKKENFSRKKPFTDYTSSEKKRTKESKSYFSDNNARVFRRESNSHNSYTNNINYRLKGNSENYYSNTPYRKFPRIHQRVAKYHDSDNENELGRREDQITYPNVENLHNEYFGRKKPSKENLSSKGKQVLKRSTPKYDNYDVEANCNDYNTERFHEQPEEDGYDSNDLDYNMRKVEGKERVGYGSDEDHGNHKKNIHDSSEFNRSDEDSKSSDTDDKSGSSDYSEMSRSNEDSKSSDIDDNTDKPNYHRDREKFVSIIARSVWDPEPGDPADDKLPQQPYNHINYIDTGSPMCYSHEDCIDVMQYIKERDKTIKYNFYIGGDNHIYEGKGWVADVNEETGYRKRALDVAFIGVFSAFHPPPVMMINSYHLVKMGMATKQIVKNCIYNFMMYQDPES